MNKRFRSIGNSVLDKSDLFGNASANHTDVGRPWTRIIKHKWFEFGIDENGKDLPKTAISLKYSYDDKPGDEPYYPDNDEKSGKQYATYKTLAEKEDIAFFGGPFGNLQHFLCCRDGTGIHLRQVQAQLRSKDCEIERES